jgi:transcriptional regulator with XRE-family HTH domain
MKTYSLRALRRRRKLTQAELARLSGQLQATISRAESRSGYVPKWPTVAALARALKVNPLQLRFGDTPADARRVAKKRHEATL